MRRFFEWIKALFNRAMDKVEDPDIMLDQARRDMQAGLIANREKAVQAITQKNRLQQMLDDHRAKGNQLESQATMALKQGNRDLAAQFMREKINNDAIIAQLQTSYDQAAGAVEQVKVAIKRQEEEVRKKSAEALAMKTQWKNAQIQNSNSKALDGLTFENQFESFGVAAEKIRMAQSEAAARQEMQGESIQGKVMAMEDKAKDYEAEDALEKLEQRLGMKPAAPAIEQTQTVSVGPNPNGQPADVPAPAGPGTSDPTVQSEAEKQLEELEKRLQGGSGS
jgi:phage shock protein A